MASTLTRDGLHLEADDLAAVRRTALSPSTAKTLSSGCAAGFAFGKLVGEQAPDPFAATTQGTAAHTVLEDLYGLPRGKRTRRKAANLLLSRVAQWRHGDLTALSDPVTRQLFIADVMGKYQGIFEIEDPREVDVAATEWHLQGVDVGGVPFAGYIDLTQHVRARGKTGLRVIDHKTGKVPDKHKIERYGDDHGDQIRLYAAGLRQITDEPVLEGRVYYTRHGKSRVIAVSAKRVAQTVGEFSRAWDVHNEMVDQAMFPTRTSPLCGWCPLVNLCPAAQASKFNTDRTEGQTALTATDLVDIEEPAVTASCETGGAPTGPVSPDEPGEEIEHSREGTDMAEYALAEGKPWEEDVAGTLNGASYATIGYFGTASLAYELLGKHNVPIQRVAVDTLTATLASIITDVQEGLTGRASFQDGTNTRVRGVLRTVLDAVPPPFGEDAGTWQRWIKMTTGHTRSIAAAAVRLAEADHPGVDIDTLTTIAPTAAED
ncbi:MAG: PD-(D/E)XK nuclease family protein [Nocardioides sp.]|nr:PD-(D/E)XK nuclease family protein [Nocardioides sp.]